MDGIWDRHGSEPGTALSSPQTPTVLRLMDLETWVGWYQEATYSLFLSFYMGTQGSGEYDDSLIITQVLVLLHSSHLLALNRLPQFFYTLKSNHGQSHLRLSRKPFPPSEVGFLAECSLKMQLGFS